MVGPKLSLNGEELRLRGATIGFGREAANDEEYADIAAMGLNAVTLPFSYRAFYELNTPTDYRAEAWNWIDEHLAAARRHRLRVVLQLLGVEGAQFVPDRDEPYDFRIWVDEQIQRNTVDLWQTIAERYRAEPTIAGYSLFPEPVCRGGVEQWAGFATALVRAVREVDSNHVLFVDRAYGEREVRRETSGIELPPERAFAEVDDDNVVYEFYFFERDEYTHQFAAWRPEPHIHEERTYPAPAVRIEYREEGSAPRTFGFDRQYLEYHLSRQLEFGRIRHVPMHVWGFGLNRECIERGRGGLEWLTDVIELFEQGGIGWNLLAYRDDYFGVAGNDDVKRTLAALAGNAAYGRE